ncbi:MAG: inositol monophosphatase family protein [Cyanobacteria bacterium P01_H01_bin.105]
MDIITISEELQRFLDVATEAAMAGGAVLEKYWRNLSSIQEKGRSGDLVTEADRASEVAVLEVLKRHVPEHAVLAEESGQSGQLDSPLLWAIDPLDGTTNYAHGYPLCAVSIGLLVSGVPTVGVVYNPILGDLYRAAKGLGATYNRLPMRVSKTATLSDSLLVTGFAYDRRETIDNNYAEFCHFTHLTQGVRRGGSASIDLAHVACGCLDGYWERGLSPWDLAAGVLLVEESGGRVSAYDGSPFDIYSGRLIATNGPLHPLIIQELSQVEPLPQFKPV